MQFQQPNQLGFVTKPEILHSMSENDRKTMKFIKRAINLQNVLMETLNGVLIKQQNKFDNWPKFFLSMSTTVKKFVFSQKVYIPSKCSYGQVECSLENRA